MRVTQKHVKLQDFMGNDKAIVDAARVSYDLDSNTTVHDDKGLIRYLMRHNHTSPFEMVEFKFYIHCPIFVARQWLRHRTASLNEVSGRYSIVKDEFYFIDEYHKQSSSNKQGSGTVVDMPDSVYKAAETWVEDSYDIYKTLINDYNVSREEARIHLPLSTYTTFIWKIDLHNLFHFLKLRTDPHAQYHIRAYAEYIEGIISSYVPLAYQAWIDYSKEAYNLSRMELDLVKTLTSSNPSMVRNFLLNQVKEGTITKREEKEFITTFITGEQSND